MGTVFRAADRDVTEPVDGYEVARLGANKLMSIGHMHFEPGVSIPEHSHPNWQAAFIYRGELTFHTDGESYVLEPGDGYTLAGNEPHYGENRGEDPVDGVYIHSPPRDLPSWEE